MFATPRLLVVGADTERRSAWTTKMRSADFDVVEAEAESDAVRLTRGWEPMGVVYEWPVGQSGSGLDLLRLLRRYEENILIVVLGEFTSSQSLREVFAAGADLCFPTTYEAGLLAVQVEVALQSRSTVPKSKIRCGDLVVDTRGRRVWRDEGEVQLTSMEFRLLVVLMEHSEEVVSKSMLLKEVWRRQDDERLGGGHLVEVHVASLRKKLDAVGPSLIRTVRGQGFLLRSIRSTAMEPRS
jgi:DNA-binding response OmpR family regulator